ncbi:MAG: ATP-binding protein [Conexivisphaerales archaeon]
MAVSQQSLAFDDMDGRFQARLKGIRTLTKQIRGGEYEATSIFAVLEAKFDIDVFDKLHDPTFIAVERETSSGMIYLVYEVTSVTPMHFQMLGVNSSIPQQIREEFLERVSDSWKGSQETWIDLFAVSTGYRLKLEDQGINYESCRLTPLQGSVVHRLSRMAVEKLLCVRDGLPMGRIKGQDIELTVDADSLLGYHIGVFGFTGTGKSNLTANLIRKFMNKVPELKVCVLDISGEYAVHLLDRIRSGIIYTTEEFGDKIEIFSHSQVIPATLEKDIQPESLLTDIFSNMHNEGRIKALNLEESAITMSLNDIYSALQEIVAEKKGGYQAVQKGLTEIIAYFRNKGLQKMSKLSELKEEDVNFLVSKLESLKGKVHEKSAAIKSIEAMIEILTSAPEEANSEADTPEQTAYKFLTGKDRLYIFYTPNPYQARIFAARYLERLLYLKKVMGLRQRILVVLDEAQEFAPQDTRGEETASSRAVEALLRQGRKYRAYGIISTQRVAHMNTNALQQLHSYFVSTLPRIYDRLVIADSFSLDLSILEKTSELDTGEWLFLSYKATQQKNVPVFIQVENNEDIIRSFLLARRE